MNRAQCLVGADDDVLRGEARAQLALRGDSEESLPQDVALVASLSSGIASVLGSGFTETATAFLTQYGYLALLVFVFAETSRASALRESPELTGLPAW